MTPAEPLQNSSEAQLASDVHEASLPPSAEVQYAWTPSTSEMHIQVLVQPPLSYLAPLELAYESA